MRDLKDKLIKRITDLKKIPSYDNDITRSAEELFSGTLSIAHMAYGAKSPQVQYLLEMRYKLAEARLNEDYRSRQLYLSALGFLVNMEKEIQADLIKSLEKEISGELFSDFIIMAKSTIEIGNKDGAAVLASAALEDSLKRLAQLNNLTADDKDMSEVINILKSNGLISGPQLKIAQSYVQLRNKAFHAEWNKIDTPEVKSLIAFVEEFVMSKFS